MNAEEDLGHSDIEAALATRREPGARYDAELVDGKKIIPANHDASLYWADEVRLSRPVKGSPRYLYASTRGLDKDCKGYVAAFNLDAEGLIVGDAIDMYETATSGGIANAVEPAPDTEEDPDIEYMALTDSQDGWIFILGFDGKKFHEAARTRLVGEDNNGLACATAVWL
jgi:carboxy-cis,cis-muconate cyclase